MIAIHIINLPFYNGVRKLILGIFILGYLVYHKDSVF